MTTTKMTVIGPGAGSITHGANHEGLLSTVAADVAEELIGIYPWVLDTDVVGIEQYCRAEARTRLLHDYALELVAKKGVERVPPHIWSEITKAESNAMRAAEALGLTPLGRMKIAKDAGFAAHFNNERIGSVRSQGAALRAAGK